MKGEKIYDLSDYEEEDANDSLSAKETYDKIITDIQKFLHEHPENDGNATIQLPSPNQVETNPLDFECSVCNQRIQKGQIATILSCCSKHAHVKCLSNEIHNNQKTSDICPICKKHLDHNQVRIIQQIELIS